MSSPIGTPLQRWFFDGTGLIKIGRSVDNDVVIADQVVSREHVYLTPDGDAWLVTVLTTQGIYCGSRKVFNLRLEPKAQAGFVFRLGLKGPFLRFDLLSEPVEDETTACPGRETSSLLELDPQRLKREVDEISEGEYFQTLRNSLRVLKGLRNPPDSTA
ncbi:FHA domain-containing protein [Paludisphaera rhizosphaerae]|uniref:FHA domain-containing protein n=1 Tax=Paludisphaera rhizosphaerae TaxID=2711216 RepID=UPI0013EDB2FD|nr:FHA domain-containing protein [Paludisphaera rhizosphaerae]